MRSVKHGKRRVKTRSFWTAKNRHNSSKRKKKAVKGFGNSNTMKSAWDSGKTPQQNLLLMGLSYDANAAVGKVGSDNTLLYTLRHDHSIKKPATGKAGEEMEVDGTDHGQVAVPEGKEKKSTATPVLAEVLEQEVSGAERTTTVRNKRKKDKKKEKMARRDRDFCLKMLEMHGNDYEAMARDPENIYQLTSTRLERKIDRFNKSSLFKNNPDLGEKVSDEMPTI